MTIRGMHTNTITENLQCTDKSIYKEKIQGFESRISLPKLELGEYTPFLKHLLKKIIIAKAYDCVITNMNIPSNTLTIEVFHFQVIYDRREKR